MLQRSRNNKWLSSLGAHSNAQNLGCYDASCLCLSAIAPVIWRRRLVIACISFLIMLPAALWTLKNTTFDHFSPASNVAPSSLIMHGEFAKLAESKEIQLLGLQQERRQAWPCLMILSVRAMSPRTSWAVSVSAALPFVSRIVILRHSNWKNNYRGGSMWQPPLQLLGKNVSVSDSSSEEDKYIACSSASTHEKACVFWNSDYNAAAALPALFDVFLRDTQKLAVAVDANRLISSAQLLMNSPLGSMQSAFSSPDIATIGEVGAVRSSLDILRLRTTSDLSVSSAMSVAADVFVPFFFNSPPQLLQVSAPLANALGELKIMRDNEFERRARRAEMYERAAAVLHSRSSLTGGLEITSRNSVAFRAICAAQYCAFMSDLAPIDSIGTRPAANGSATPPLTAQLQSLQQQLRHVIDASCLLEPDHSCRCCPVSALPPLSRAVDALPATHWMSPPVQQASFFGLDLLAPVQLRSVVVDVGHSFQRSLVLEVLHSLGDSWLPLHSEPHATPVEPAVGSYGGSSSKRDHSIMRFTYDLERELRDVWRLQTGAFPGVRLPVFSVQMLRFRSLTALPHPFVVYEIKYEVASKE